MQIGGGSIDRPELPSNFIIWEAHSCPSSTSICLSWDSPDLSNQLYLAIWQRAIWTGSDENWRSADRRLELADSRRTALAAFSTDAVVIVGTGEWGAASDLVLNM